LKEAHDVKLPKENIERAINRAKDKASANFETGQYEIFGHGGVGLVVSTLTDNPNRAIFDIKGCLGKAGVKMASGGSILFQFEQKAVFSPQPGGKFDKDMIFEKAIEKEIEDINFLPQINGLTIDNANSKIIFLPFSEKEFVSYSRFIFALNCRRFGIYCCEC
jgi:transcriptional/translational regulatory protein YebC/TACO1